MTSAPARHKPAPRYRVLTLESSKIREVSNVGSGMADVIPLWFGEPDVTTPDFIRSAAKRSLDAGETFYGPNLGLEALRNAIAAYHAREGRHVAPSRVCVTASGVNALMLAAQAIVEPGDDVVLPSPHWPHLAEIPTILGANVRTVPLRLQAGEWKADVDELCDAITPSSRLVVLNSPSNPTGWTMSRSEQLKVLERCRSTGTWILADEVYSRMSFAGSFAPSFLDISDEDDRLFVVHSFSKSWAMTGWRLGWIVAPASLVDAVAKLIEYNMSCASTFVQRAGIAALDSGDEFLATLVERYREMRDLCLELIGSHDRVTMPVPKGGIYVFFKVEGVQNSLAFAKDLLEQARIGLAPGIAFGTAGEGYLRLCFASSRERLIEACARFNDFLSSAGKY